MTPRDRHLRKGTSLIEVMLAGAILLLVVLSLLEGFIVAARIAKASNGEPLVADAYAYDLAWTLFNQQYANITVDEQGTTYNIPSTIVPALSSENWPAPTATIKVKKVMHANADIGRQISVDVAWGARGKRKGRHLEVMRSRFSRAPE